MWATFSFDALQRWLKECHNQDQKNITNFKNKTYISQDEILISCGSQSSVSNIDEQWFIPK